MKAYRAFQTTKTQTKLHEVAYLVEVFFFFLKVVEGRARTKTGGL